MTSFRRNNLRKPMAKRRTIMQTLLKSMLIRLLRKRNRSAGQFVQPPLLLGNRDHDHLDLSFQRRHTASSQVSNETKRIKTSTTTNFTFVVTSFGNYMRNCMRSAERHVIYSLQAVFRSETTTVYPLLYLVVLFSSVSCLAIPCQVC